MIISDMVENSSTDRKPLYNLIIKRETLNKLKAVLGLKNSVKQSVILPMQSLSAIQDHQYVMIVYRESLELKSLREETNHMYCIIDARYEKALLQDVVNMHCQHLSASQ